MTTADLPVDSAETTLNPTAVSADAPPVVAVPEQDDAPDANAKPEPTASEREAAALKRRVDRLTREKYQTRAELDQLRQSQPQRQPEAPTDQPLTHDVIHQRAMQIANERSFVEKCNGINASGLKAYPDFAAKVGELNADGYLFDDKGAPTPTMDAVLDAENPAALLHHLGSNPDLAAELAEMTPRQQIRKLALIERDLGEKPQPKSSNAPKPLQPVKSVAAGGSPDAEKDPEAWVAWRNAQKRGK